MKLKNNKAFMIILFFIFFILLNNVSYGADWFEFTHYNIFYFNHPLLYTYYTHYAQDLINDTDSVPTLDYFKNLENLKKLELNKPYMWSNKIDSNNTYLTTYVFLCYLNEFTGQAVLLYAHTESSVEYEDIPKNYEYYLIDFKKDIIINTELCSYSNNTVEFTSLSIILNENNEIQQLESFSDVIGFKVFNVVDDYCTFVFSKASGSDPIRKQSITLENNIYVSEIVSYYPSNRWSR